MTDLFELSIRESHHLLATKQISSVELTAAVLDHIRKTDPHIHAFVTLAEEPALEQARQADERLRSGENVTPLTGIPFGVKDCISTKAVRTTCSSKILENYIPQYNATVIDRLSAAGAVLVGKHNMDEFGMGSSCENSAFFATHNPWDLERVPGGSSGGSAAAVAADMGAFALGEDTGGSIRMPAGFCNVTGLKTTYGRVSRYGLIALVSSFDSIGPLARSAWDCAAVLADHRRAGCTGRHLAACPRPGLPVRSWKAPVKGLRLGIPKEYFQPGMEAGVESSIREAIQTVRRTRPGSPRSFPAAHPLCPAGLLPDPVRRGQRQPGALRRHPFRFVGGRRRRECHRSVPANPPGGLRRGGQAAHHAGRVRALGRLL